MNDAKWARAVSLRGLILSATAILLAGCASEAAQLVIVVDTDIPHPSQLDSVRFAVTGPSGRMLEVGQTVGGPDDPSFPLTLTLVPTGQLEPFTIRVSGRSEGEEIVAQTRRVALEAERSLAVYFFLTQRCVQVPCDEAAGQTCDRGRCESVDVIPDPWTGAPARDGGPLDAGIDASELVDGSVDARVDATHVLDADRLDAPDVLAPDTATPDAPGPDVPRTCDLGCDDDDACTDDRCVDGRCVYAPSCPCSTSEECPPDDPLSGPGPCEYPSECAEDGAQTRMVARYSCVSGQCVRSVVAVTDPGSCERNTTGLPCPAGDGQWSTCAPTALFTKGGVALPECETRGVRTRTPVSGVCSDQQCVPLGEIETEPCAIDPTGQACTECTTRPSCRCGADDCENGAPMSVPVYGVADPAAMLAMSCIGPAGPEACTATSSAPCLLECAPGATVTLDCTTTQSFANIGFSGPTIMEPDCMDASSSLSTHCTASATAPIYAFCYDD